MALMSDLERVQAAPVCDPVRRAEGGPWTIELLPACAYEARYVAAQSGLGFAFDSQRGLHAIGSDRVQPFDALPNGLAFVPAGCDVFSESAHGGEYLRVMRNDGAQFRQVRPFNNLIDQPAIRLAQQMRKALLNASIEADWEAWALALVARATADDAPAAPAPGSMTNKRLCLLDEYIEASLDGPLSVQSMAGLLGLSEGFFIRAFAEATGKTPHSYLIDRRLARARTLLRTSTDRLADIAQTCGFASQAHMATTFRQRLGTSPADLRQPILNNLTRNRA